MNITKYDHSCFLIEKDGRALLFDPVEYEHQLPTFNNLDAIIITHLHGDHFQPKILQKIMADNPNVQIFTTADNAANVNQANIGPATIAKDGDEIKSGVFNLAFFGKDHAAIVDNQAPCQNIATLVDGIFFHPGDSFEIPSSGSTPEILVVPIAAPWLKIEESMHFIRNIKPKIVVPAHDAVNSAFGNTLCDNWILKVCDEIGAQYKPVHYGKI